MPVDQQALLSDCQDQLEYLEADLATQAEADKELAARLRAEYALAREAGRVGDAFEIWRGEQATQAAVQWVLGGVFVRFLEDNGLLPEPLLAGEADRGRLAEAAEQAFITANPALHERHWFLHVFRTIGRLPGAGALFDEAHNPVFHWPLTPEAAKRLLQFWRRTDPATGRLAHDFTDREWDTRFLGDLYQELSESARKKYALLQTPIFVEEFILDRTLGEALQQLPLPKVTVIDPTCGSGHFLLGAFSRLLAAWERHEAGTPLEALAQRALDQVAGVDLNPFAVAIARFRLLMAALRACGVTRLDRAPAFRIHVAVGDSLLHGDEPGRLDLGNVGTGRFVRHAFSDEDLAEVNAVLGRRYAVVVGNPPYIVPKDKALNKAYRERYRRSCHMKYALSAPFIERFWQLAVTDAGGGVAGWTGQITANSFMKREFGKKVIEEFFPRVDLTHVIDTAGAYIPGHGTPTVILFGRARPPQTEVVRALLGIRGEPQTPGDPAKGDVWAALLDQVDRAGSESDFFTVVDVPRSSFRKHPWSIGGGGASELKEAIETKDATTLDGLGASVGITSFTLEDAAFLMDRAAARRRGIEDSLLRPMLEGDEIRDWSAHAHSTAVFPYDRAFEPAPLQDFPGAARHLWLFRTVLASNIMFGGKTKVEAGLRWYEYGRLTSHKLAIPLSITFAEVATHNHFVLDRGGVVFKQTAPVVMLPPATSEEVHLGLLGLLNSSTACFWLKQVTHNKGSTVDQRGARQRTAPFEDFYQYNGTKVGAFPVTRERPTLLATRLDALARERQEQLPGALCTRRTTDRVALGAARAAAERLLARMVALQEELDWRSYQLFGVTTEGLTYDAASGPTNEPPPLRLGERAFEIALARGAAAGEEQTTWFERHGSTPITKLPAEWPADYRALVERRIAAIESDRNIGLIERPEYKRRWNVESWETLQEEALRAWLLDRLETAAYWPDVAVQSTRDLAARAALDPEFGQVASLWVGSEGVELEPTIRRLVVDEAVPFLPALRYTKGGRERRRVWERTWDLQRQEDAVDARVAASFERIGGESDQRYASRLAEEQKRRRATEVGDIPRPPKYSSADFQSPVFWRLRGALDVPKERFIIFPFANREGDDAPVVGWAGWNHLQRAQALTAWYSERMERDGWTGERLIPLLAGMAELLPWLKQWHNEIDPEFGDRPGDVYESWLEGELLQHGLTRAALDAWEPPRAHRQRGSRAAASQE
jgi:hypothetical protein